MTALISREAKELSGANDGTQSSLDSFRNAWLYSRRVWV